VSVLSGWEGGREVGLVETGIGIGGMVWDYYYVLRLGGLLSYALRIPLSGRISAGFYCWMEGASMLGGITADGRASCFTHLVGCLLFTLHGEASLFFWT
jgi:hypothetical protein